MAPLRPAPSDLPTVGPSSNPDRRIAQDEASVLAFEVVVDDPTQLTERLGAVGARVERQRDSLAVRGVSARQVGEAAAAAGAVVYRLAEVGADLEDVYFRLAGRSTAAEHEGALR